MQLDEHGYPQPTGQLETLAADTLILAVGQDADTGFLHQLRDVEFKRDGTVVVSASMMTGSPGVFAGGDMVPAERTVTVGVGHGKKAARFIDAYLRDLAPADRPSPSLTWPSSACCTRGTSPTPHSRPAAGAGPSRADRRLRRDSQRPG